MEVSKMQFGVLFLLLSGALLAGCQAEDVRFKISDQRVPEQVGLRIEWLRDFGSAASLASQPTNLGRFYREQGELDFRYFRVTNTSNESREVYPSVAGAEAGLALNQFFQGLCPRDSYDCPIPMTGPFPSDEETTSAYRSEFEIRGVDFVFDSGGREPITTETGNPKPIMIRAGESAVVQLRLGLRSGFPLRSSAPVEGGMPPGQGFFPADLRYNPLTRFERTEWLLGVRVEGGPEITLLDRNPVTDELNPIYFDRPTASLSIFTGNWAASRGSFPPTRVAETINGLAEQK